MTATDVRKRFTGVFGFPITPFRKDLSLDLDALARNVAGMVQHPFCALVAAGGTGELYSMTVDEIVEVVRVTVQAAGGCSSIAAIGPRSRRSWWRASPSECPRWPDGRTGRAARASISAS